MANHKMSVRRTRRTLVFMGLLISVHARPVSGQPTPDAPPENAPGTGEKPAVRAEPKPGAKVKTVSKRERRERAKQLFAEGERLFADRDYARALAAYREAYQTEPIPEFLFNIGQCYRNLGDLQQAVSNFQDYLKQKPNAHNAAAVRVTIADLESQIRGRGEKRPQPAKTRRSKDKHATSTSTSTSTLVKGAVQGDQGPRDLGLASAVRSHGGGDKDRGRRSVVFYKRWQFWTGVALVGAAGTATGVYLATQGRDLPSSDLGNLDFPR